MIVKLVTLFIFKLRKHGYVIAYHRPSVSQNHLDFRVHTQQNFSPSVLEQDDREEGQHVGYPHHQPSA